ncbi:MAG: hypothetical protein V4479_15560 [Actinomycetota bacterium]
MTALPVHQSRHAFLSFLRKGIVAGRSFFRRANIRRSWSGGRMLFRALSAVAAGIVVVIGLLGTPAVAVAASPTASTGSCLEQPSTSSCDSDHDGIPDVIEVKVCGTGTCATGRGDRDHDGIADWVEVEACGTATCANPATDIDGDGIPDYAEILTCGSAVCAGGREDADGDGIPDWVEFVICGNRSCANGSEDYDNDGVSDAKELAACLIRFDVTGPAVFSGFPFQVTKVPGGGIRVVVVWWPLIVGALLALAGLVFAFIVILRRRRAAEDPVDPAAPIGDIDELLGVDK